MQGFTTIPAATGGSRSRARLMCAACHAPDSTLSERARMPMGFQPLSAGILIDNMIIRIGRKSLKTNNRRSF